MFGRTEMSTNWTHRKMNGNGENKMEKSLLVIPSCRHWSNLFVLVMIFNPFKWTVLFRTVSKLRNMKKKYFFSRFQQEYIINNSWCSEKIVKNGIFRPLRCYRTENVPFDIIIIWNIDSFWQALPHKMSKRKKKQPVRGKKSLILTQ